MRSRDSTVGVTVSPMPKGLNATVTDPRPAASGTGSSPPARKLALCPLSATRVGSASTRHVVPLQQAQACAEIVRVIEQRESRGQRRGLVEAQRRGEAIGRDRIGAAPGTAAAGEADARLLHHGTLHLDHLDLDLDHAARPGGGQVHHVLLAAHGRGRRRHGTLMAQLRLGMPGQHRLVAGHVHIGPAAHAAPGQHALDRA